MGVFMDQASSATDNFIPRDLIFGNPDKTNVKVSHDGKYISYLAPKDGVLNIFITSAHNLEHAVPLTHNVRRGIRIYFWAYDSKHVIFLQDSDGDEYWNIYKTSLITAKPEKLTDFKGVQARILKVSHKFPTEIIVGINKRNKEYHDVYKLNIETGKLDLLFENNNYSEFIIDDDYKIRFMEKMTSDGDKEIYKYDNKKEELFLRVPKEDILTTQIVDFDKSGKNAYFISSLERNTAGLYLMNIKTKERKFIFGEHDADVDSIILDPMKKTLQAVSYNYERQSYYVPDPKTQEDFGNLQAISDGDIYIKSRDFDNNLWIVAFISDVKPVLYYLYDRTKQKAQFLFTQKKELEDYKLSHMHPVVITSRDGLKLVSYLTLPVNSVQKHKDLIPKKPVPIVSYVHGGPSARDLWGFNKIHQWLANRGYAVLSVNYRGSTGFGKEFINAGNSEWSGKMHDDLIDAVNWAVKKGIADKKRVAIMGASYGGYATLVGLTFTPNVFACGVDIVGPSNLITLLNSVPPYWKPLMDWFITITGGDVETEEGRKILASKSPINKVDNITKPLLIGQGANDPRVRQHESDQIVEKMESKKIPVIYALYPDEGHGFARPENNLSFFAITEAFFAQYLGGKFEPIENDFNNTTLEIKAGKKYLPKSIRSKLNLLDE